jgi:hypothetical protein
MIVTGALLGCVLLPDLLPPRARLIVWVTASLGLLVPIVRPRLLRDALRRLPGVLRVGDAAIPTRAGMVRIAAAFVVMWIAHGFAFWVFCTAFAPISGREIGAATGSFALAYVAGLAALIAPGGIGVREEILGHALTRVVPDGPVHVLAVSARVWTIVAEVVVLGAALWLRFRARRSPS